MILAQIIGGPLDGEYRSELEAGQPVEFTEVLSNTPPLDADETYQPPTRTVSIVPTYEYLPSGFSQWILRWPRLDREGVPA